MSGTKPVRVERVRQKIVIKPNGEAKLYRNFGHGTDADIDMYFPKHDGETTRILRSRNADGRDVGEFFQVAKQSHYLTLYVKAAPGRRRRDVIKGIERLFTDSGIDPRHAQAQFRDGECDCREISPKTGKEHEHKYYRCGRQGTVPIWISIPCKSYDDAAYWFAESSKYFWVDQNQRDTQYGASAGIVKSVLPSTGTQAHMQSRVANVSTVRNGEIQENEQVIPVHALKKLKGQTVASKNRRRSTKAAILKELRGVIYDGVINSSKPIYLASQRQRQAYPMRNSMAMYRKPWTEFQMPKSEGSHNGFVG